MSSSEKRQVSAAIRKVLSAMETRVNGFDYDVGKELVSLYCPLEGNEVSWAAIRVRKWADTLTLLLRRYDPADTTVPVTAASDLRTTRQGTWVTARDADDAVVLLSAHLTDLRNRVAVAERRGQKVFDNRTFRRGRQNREFTPRVKES